MPDPKSISTFIIEKLHLNKEEKKIGIITGTGLSGIADVIEDKKSLDYSEIPDFPRTKVKGHPGKIICGTIANKPVVCLQGRIHFYEGHSFREIGDLVRILHGLGVSSLIVSNAAGGINSEYAVGDVMIIKDHINLTGDNALRGVSDAELGSPFINIYYDRELRAVARSVGAGCGLGSRLREGVYAIINGPSYETIAENSLLRLAGADAVGMSTIPEVQTASHVGMRVLAFSLITNVSSTEYDSYYDSVADVASDVYVVGREAMPGLVAFVRGLIAVIDL